MTAYTSYASETNLSKFGQMLPPTLQLWFCPTIQQATSILAEMRTKAHDGNRRAVEDMGAARNRACDEAGLGAELTLFLAMERHGLKPEAYVLYSERPPAGPDFLLGDVRFQVKCAPFGTTCVNFNEKKRLDPRHAFDFLLPMAYAEPDQIAVFLPVSAAEVAGWPLRTVRDDFRSLPLERLKPLCSLRQLSGFQR